MTRSGPAAALAIAVLAAAVAAGPRQSGEYATAEADLVQVEREAYLMGTRARLVAYDADRAAGVTALDAALRAMERTEDELSTWRADSALSRLNRTPVGTPWLADPALCSLVDELYRWTDATGGAFDPAVGALADAWAIHGHGRVPSDHERDAARAASGLDRLVFDRTRCTLTRTADVTIDPGAFGKGEALDRAAAVLGTRHWLIDFGGQVSVGGGQPDGRPWTIDVADPRRRDRAFLQVRMRDGSLSTSGGSERDQRVGGTRVGHILDPRTARPAPFDGSVSVWHERGLVADILSTALFVMGPDAGLRWAETRGLSALYLIPDGETVRQRATPAFDRLQ